METALPEHITDFGAVAAERFAILGGPQAALLTESDRGLRRGAATALRELGAFDLDVRASTDELLAAAALCRAAGATLLPYPVVEELLAVDGAKLALIDPRAPRVDHGDLGESWRLADLDGTLYTATMGSAVAGSGGHAKLGPFTVAAQNLQLAGAVPLSDVRLHLILTSWRLLGAVERAVQITSDHVQARTQFGKPLSDFQTVRFRMADTSVALRGLEELAKFTLSRWTDAPSAIGWTDAVMLKIQAADTSVTVMRTCHQLLGALGFCDESDISVIDRHIQPALRSPESAVALTVRLLPSLAAGDVQTLFSTPAAARS